MSDYVGGMDRKQTVLFPETIDEYVGGENPVRFIDAFVDMLDLQEMGFTHAEPGETGRPPYNPADLLKLYIYGYISTRDAPAGSWRLNAQGTWRSCGS